ncbi:flagellar basal body protein [Paenibacillus sp. JTLBN-2024]
MNNSMISAMVSMNGIQRKLDVIADNIANLDTVGYKQKDTTFEDTLTSVMQQPKDFKQQGRFSPRWDIRPASASVRATFSVICRKDRWSRRTSRWTWRSKGKACLRSKQAADGRTRGKALSISFRIRAFRGRWCWSITKAISC